ncbi:MAG TPA: carboxypeptidase-like regulatory domain-containing protein [Gemmatimonadales bacterium]|nr:carboxypeptidase-like regulatory domain-containing protein [Gemmatimonadales bacterium]
MRTLTPVLLGAFLAMACSKSTTAPKPTGYECLGQAYPTSAPASITVSGTVADFINGPLAGARVYAFKTGTAGAIDSATTDAGGAFSMSVSTGGTPLDGYLKASKSGYIDTYAYPSAPLPANAIISVPVVTSGEFGILAGMAGATQVAGNGALGLLAVDCTGAAVTGATVTTSPSSSPYAYQSEFFVFNAPPGGTTVGASFQGHTFHSHSILSVADAVTITIIAPGPLSPPE